MAFRARREPAVHPGAVSAAAVAAVAAPAISLNTDCAGPGYVQIDATPNDLGVIGGEMDEPMFGLIGW